MISKIKVIKVCYSIKNSVQFWGMVFKLMAYTVMFNVLMGVARHPLVGCCLQWRRSHRSGTTVSRGASSSGVAWPCWYVSVSVVAYHRDLVSLSLKY